MKTSQKNLNVLFRSRLYDAQEQEVPDQSFSLSSYFFNASLLPQAGFIDNAIRGLTKQPPLVINPEYTAELTNYFNKYAPLLIPQTRTGDCN